ncbi:MAG TPA: hypothetical protein VMT47_15015, partial [Polyangia bacterium]|nr:hypothetical protein [Polyangia bacterium]
MRTNLNNWALSAAVLIPLACSAGANEPSVFQGAGPGYTGGAAPAGSTGGSARPATFNSPNATIPGPRSVQEADIYKLVGNTLYILSSKRGLEMVDVTDVQSPKLLSTLPTKSSPRQIYV